MNFLPCTRSPVCNYHSKQTREWSNSNLKDLNMPIQFQNERLHKVIVPKYHYPSKLEERLHLQNLQYKDKRLQRYKVLQSSPDRPIHLLHLFHNQPERKHHRTYWKLNLIKLELQLGLVHQILFLYIAAFVHLFQVKNQECQLLYAI